VEWSEEVRLLGGDAGFSGMHRMKASKASRWPSVSLCEMKSLR